MPYRDEEQRRTHQRRYYLDNQDRYKEAAAARNKALRDEKRDNLLTYLQGRHCADCPESDPIVLQFDHVRGEKVKDIGAMLADWGCSWAQVKTEIDKCDVVCANCHLRRTAARHGGWFKSLHA